MVEIKVINNNLLTNMKYLNYNQYSYNDVIINMRAAFFNSQ